MTRHDFLLIFTVILAVFGLCVCSAGAQDVDVDEMSNEQLMQLLQDIMRKLNDGGEAEEPTAVPTVLALPTAEPTPEPTAFPLLTENRTFRVYENKKLIVGSMPSSYFVNPTREPDEHRPMDECIDYCNYEVCRGTSYKCFYDCVIECSGTTPPEPKG